LKEELWDNEDATVEQKLTFAAILIAFLFYATLL